MKHCLLWFDPIANKAYHNQACSIINKFLPFVVLTYYPNFANLEKVLACSISGHHYFASTLHGKYIIMQAICTHFANIIQSKMHTAFLTVIKSYHKFRIIKPISSTVCWLLSPSISGGLLISCINLGVQKFIVHAWRHMCCYTFCGFLLKYLLVKLFKTILNMH